MCVGTKFVFTACLLVFEIQHVSAQGTLSVVTEKKYKCGSTVKLRCAPTGCCSGTILWRKNTTQIIMAAGISTPAGKYTQTTVASSHFDFTIEDIALTDFGSSYVCVFKGSQSNDVTLNVGDYYCPPCWDCGGICVGFSTIGVVILIVLVAVTSKFIGKLKEKFLMVTVVSCGTGLLVDVIATICIGSYTCLCEYGKGFTCIFIGFGITLPVVIVVVLIFYFISAKGSEKEENTSATKKTTGT